MKILLDYRKSNATSLNQLRKKNNDSVTREALHIVEKQSFLNQNPEKDFVVIPGNSSDINRSTKYKSSELDNDSYQERSTKLQQGSVQQQIFFRC